MKRYAKLARRVLSESKVLTVRCPTATGPYVCLVSILFEIVTIFHIFSIFDKM